MRWYPSPKEIAEYNALTADEIKAKRKKHKVWVIKRTMSDVKDTAGQITITLAQKTFYVSIIGLGAIAMCTGLVTKEPISAVFGIACGTGIGMLGALSLKEENEKIGVIDLLHYLKNDIQEMYWDIKNTNAYYPMPDEKKGRSLK